MVLLAHTTVEGAGDVVNGALHPFVTPSHVLVLLGLGLLLGQQVPLNLGRSVKTFLPLSAVSLALTMSGKFPPVPQPVLISIALVIAAMVGWGRRFPAAVGSTACVAVALAVGLDSAVESGPTFHVVKMLLGTWLSMSGLVIYLAMAVSNGAEKEWARTAIRVIGSWIFAISLLVLAFSLRK